MRVLIRPGFVNPHALQFTGSEKDWQGPKLITCTGGGTQWGLEQPLMPCPEGSEIFGSTTLAVRDTVTDSLHEVVPGDWVVWDDTGTSVAVMTNVEFNILFQEPQGA